MRKPVRIGAEADAELRGAVSFYEQLGAGLGAKLLDAVEAAVVIEHHPKVGCSPPGVPSDRNVREVPLRRFPYRLMYLGGQRESLVLALAPFRRGPGDWPDFR